MAKTRIYAMILMTGLLLRAEGPVLWIFRPGSANNMHLYVEKTGLLSGKKHDFIFEDYEGQVAFDGAKPANSRIALMIKSASIVCKDTWVSPKDLKNIMKAAVHDMLAADRFPVIEFRSSAIREIASGQFEVTGPLTIRDKSRPVSVSVKQTSFDPPVFEGKATIRLTDFGLKPPSAALGLVGTKDEMAVIFSFAAGTK
jgi:polyisoprenoid-binding protein YceI